MYKIPESADTDQLKFDYCINIRDHMGSYCGWNKG